MENLLIGNSLIHDTSSYKTIEQFTGNNGRTQIYNVKKGWLLPYVILGDSNFNNERWLWWLQCLAKKTIEEPIPQIQFSPIGNNETRKHMEKAIEHLSERTYSWNALGDFIDWILWGLGKGDFPNIDEEVHNWLYRYFQIGRLQQFPHDYLGDIIAERKSNGWNPNAFFPTPENVVNFMVKMQFGNGNEEKSIFNKTLDPAVGTGRFLMYGSNHTVQLYGIDIDPTMVKVCMINMFLYAPWAVMPASATEERPYYEISDSLSYLASNLLFISQRFVHEFAEYSKQSQKTDDGNGNGNGKKGKTNSISEEPEESEKALVTQGTSLKLF